MMTVPAGLEAKLRIFGALSHEQSKVSLAANPHFLVQVLPHQEESIFLEKFNARSRVIEVPNSQRLHDFMQPPHRCVRGPEKQKH